MDSIAALPLKICLLFKLCNQDIVLELTYAEAAVWLRCPLQRSKFVEKLEGKIHLKDRQYNMVVSFFHILIDISSPETIHRIEEDSCIPSNAISQIHWTG